MVAQNIEHKVQVDGEAIQKPTEDSENSTRTTIRVTVQSAILTVLTLFGGLLLGLLFGDIVFNALPGHSVDNPSPTHIAIASLPALAGFLAGGAAWGVSMGRIAGATNRRRMAFAGLLGFGPITITLAIGLSLVETIASTSFLAQLPIHRLFTILFVPAAFLIAGTSAWAIGKGLKNKSLAWSLFWRVGIAAAATFLIVNLLMEASGWVVGGPGAAQRLTMVTVLAAGNLSAALVGGGTMGWKLG